MKVAFDTNSLRFLFERAHHSPGLDAKLSISEYNEVLAAISDARRKRWSLVLPAPVISELYARTLVPHGPSDELLRKFLAEFEPAHLTQASAKLAGLIQRHLWRKRSTGEISGFAGAVKRDWLILAIAVEEQCDFILTHDADFDKTPPEIADVKWPRPIRLNDLAAVVVNQHQRPML